MGIPVRHAYIRVFQPRQRVVLTYDGATESVSDMEGVISDDHLKSLDKELAPYPFEGLELWKALTEHIDQQTLDTVVPHHRMNGMTSVIGEEAEKGETDLKLDVHRDGDGMRFAQFRLKRSWRDGAVGEEVTRYSKDKSWLFGRVVESDMDNGGFVPLGISKGLMVDPRKLLAQLQLAFVLLVHLSSYGALTVYKRLLPLFTRSSSLLVAPNDYLPSSVDVPRLYAEFVSTLAAQLRALPNGVFETELPEFDLFFLDEIESLRQNLASAPWRKQVEQPWRELRKVGQTWNWRLEDIGPEVISTEEDEEDEEGEYAPVVVDM